MTSPELAAVLAENRRLKAEIQQLKAMLLDEQDLQSALGNGVEVINQIADLFPPRRRAKFKADLRKALRKSRGDPRAELKVLRDHLKKANELLREAGP
jgi:hypothetical protein